MKVAAEEKAIKVLPPFHLQFMGESKCASRVPFFFSPTYIFIKNMTILIKKAQ